MNFGTVALTGLLVLIVAGVGLWVLTGLLNFCVESLMSSMRSAGVRENIPDGADEPDGSSSVVVDGEVRLD
jgi:hypothetical protein